MTANENKDYLSFDETRYRPVFEVDGKNEILSAIWREAYGDDYPEELEPFGFVTVADLTAIKAALDLVPGRTLLDVGCGRGGPGLWMARELEARLIGIDVLDNAVEKARRFARRFELAFEPEFQVGSFTDTKLAAASVDAVMSVDSFWMVLNKPVALTEVRRVLRAGGRFVLTTWAPVYLDHRTLLSSNGFHVSSCEETPDWEARQLAVYRKIVDRRDQIRKDIGIPAADVLVSEAREAAATLSSAPRVMIVAEKKG